jgi:very-short-patch-repair endonuclease
MKNQDNRWHTSPSFWEKLKPKAREMRHKPTEAEKYLWRYLRDRKLKRFKFRRQHSLGQFVVDFYCEEINLVIEIDGPIHEFQKEKDEARQKYLENHKYKIVHFANESVLNNPGEVLEQITSILV